MRHAIVLCSLLPLLVGPGDVASAQQAATGARAEIVRLDVVVTDADGKLVRDLRREDFRILEDGKPQAITQFLVVTRSPAAPVAAPAVAEAPSTAKPAAPAEPVGPAPAESPAGPGRYVAIFVDDLHIAAANLDRTKEALHRFVAEFLGPDDRVAIVTSSGPEGPSSSPRIAPRSGQRSTASSSGRRTSLRPAARR